MSSQGLHRDAVNNGPKAMTDALVALNDVIRKLILEQNEIENKMIRQRVVQFESGHNDQGKQKTCLYQDRHLATANIQTLQEVWENMATGFGLPPKK
ncbi:hypothetical protein N7497_010975 [Penicillium chrysogenum]|nr:hypothetical protein N7497_010975 [Penicillium chrysogenum]